MVEQEHKVTQNCYKDGLDYLRNILNPHEKERSTAILANELRIMRQYNPGLAVLTASYITAGTNHPHIEVPLKQSGRGMLLGFALLRKEASLSKRELTEDFMVHENSAYYAQLRDIFPLIDPNKQLTELDLVALKQHQHDRNKFLEENERHLYMQLVGMIDLKREPGILNGIVNTYTLFNDPME